MKINYFFAGIILIALNQPALAITGYTYEGIYSVAAQQAAQQAIAPPSTTSSSVAQSAATPSISGIVGQPVTSTLVLIIILVLIQAQVQAQNGEPKALDHLVIKAAAVKAMPQAAQQGQQ